MLGKGAVRVLVPDATVWLARIFINAGQEYGKQV
jgi:hypothetical protein